VFDPVRSPDDFELVKRLLRGRSDYEVARLTGIPRATVWNWRHRSSPPRGCIRRSFTGWRPPDAAAYCYLLGLYLGDGCISVSRRKSARLGLTLDAVYPAIVEEAKRAIERTVPTVPVCRNKKGKSRAVVLLASHPVWPYAFPQHGPGRKHARPIALATWQRELTHRHPESLIRGLIHSDGSRTINRFRIGLPSGRVGEYVYSRYFFSNLSADIRRIFCEHCDLLGIRWTQSNHRNVSVSYRDSVALLDSFVGPKR
jgi:hypothetical protein